MICGALATVLCLTAGLCDPAGPQHTPTRTGVPPAMRTADDLVQALDGLADSLEWTPAAVEAFTHVPLAPVPGSSPYFSVFRGIAAAGGPLASIELRVPGAGAAAAAGPLIILTVVPGLKADLARLERRFGEPIDLDPPPPTAAAGLLPAYYTFRRRGTLVKVGLSDSDEEFRTLALERPRR